MVIPYQVLRQYNWFKCKETGKIFPYEELDDSAKHFGCAPLGIFIDTTHELVGKFFIRRDHLHLITGVSHDPCKGIDPRYVHYVNLHISVEPDVDHMVVEEMQQKAFTHEQFAEKHGPMVWRTSWRDNDSGVEYIECRTMWRNGVPYVCVSGSLDPNNQDDRIVEHSSFHKQFSPTWE